MAPYPLLPPRTGEDDRHLKSESVAGEVAAELITEGIEMGVVAGHHGIVQMPVEPTHLAFKPATVEKIEGVQSVAVRERHHRAERGFKMAGQKTVAVLCLARREAKRVAERLAECAGRFKASVKLSIRQASTGANVLQREAHSPSPMVGQEGHPGVFFELPPGRRRVDAHRSQVLIGYAPGLGPLDRVQQAVNESGWASDPIKGAATFARPVPMMKGSARRGEKLHMLGIRFSCGASRTAKDARRPDRGIEQTFYAGIAGKKGPEHRLAGRQRGEP